MVSDTSLMYLWPFISSADFSLRDGWWQAGPICFSEDQWALHVVSDPPTGQSELVAMGLMAESGSIQVSRGLVIEWASHFCCIILANASHKSSPQQRILF